MGAGARVRADPGAGADRGAAAGHGAGRDLDQRADAVVHPQAGSGRVLDPDLRVAYFGLADGFHDWSIRENSGHCEVTSVTLNLFQGLTCFLKLCDTETKFSMTNY